MANNKFGILRRVLRALGLSEQAADDVVNFIADLLDGERDTGQEQAAPEFPYHLRDNFLSPAERSFYGVLQTALENRFAICIKVGLRDIFYVKKNDPSKYRIYTNKIDRKHVDFLICDPATMQPLLGIELDDKSHERQDRQQRDAFVDGVFRAAKLPLIHIPVRRTYRTDEVLAQLAPHLHVPAPVTEKTALSDDTAPTCPKCGSEMVLRTAKKGANTGNQFWGCSNYPTCRGVVQYDDAS